MSLSTRLVLCLLICSNYHANGSQLISGDSSSATTTTSFAIGVHDFNHNGDVLGNKNLYIGASSAVANNQYAVAYANTSTNQLVPLATATITYNNTAAQSNPLNGAKIDFLKLNVDKPIVIKNGDKKVYKYKSASAGSLSLLSSSEIADTGGATTDSIIALEGAHDSAKVFVACNSSTASSSFGDSGSGIALLQENTTNGTTTLDIQNNGNANALDTASSSIKINNDLSSLANAVDMHWSSELGCLFVGLQATSGSTSGDGARSIAVGKIQQASGASYNEIVFEKIAPDAAFTGNNQIIGNASASATVSTLKIKTMITSTGLNYLIVVGGNGSANSVGNQVYALPLVSASSSNKGHLAKYNQTPTDTFDSNGFFSSRTLATAASSSSDLLTSSSAAAKVGAGILPLDASETISDLFTNGDCVYASVGTTSASDATGIWYSQAILDNNGLVTAWTPWQRVGGSTAAAYGAALDAKNGFFWYLNGSDASSVNTIKKTIWGSGTKDGLLGGTTADESTGFVANISSLFTSANGGLFNLINVPKEDSALSGISLLLATGYQKVAIINPGAASGGDFTTGLISSTDDSFPSASSSSTIAAIAGDNLSSLGPIVTAHVATNSSSESWMIVGGAGGVAVLRQSDGSGWSTALTSLAGISTSYSFEALGSYSYVKKITSDSSYLYILTDKKLDRIPLSSANMASPTATTIAEVGSSTTGKIVMGTTSADVLNDIIISGKLGLLATSKGLYRVENSGDIGSASGTNWVAVVVPEQASAPCSQLIAISPTGLDSGLSNGGNLYVISSYIGYHQTQVNRFYVKLNTNVGSTTVQALPDIFVQNNNSYFLNFESFRSGFFTDGSFLINYLSKDTTKSSYAHLMQPGQRSGLARPAAKDFYDICASTIGSSNFVSNVLRSSSSGALLVSGEFGIQVNE